MTQSTDLPEGFLTAYVSQDTKIIGIEHDTDAPWQDILAAHIALRDRLNVQIAEQERCPYKPEQPQSTDFLAELAELAERATDAPWEVQDGAVLYPTTYSATDRHPDLSAAKGNDLYSNLALIVLLRNNLPAILAMGRERDAYRERLLEYLNDPMIQRVGGSLNMRARRVLEGGNQ